MLDYTLDVPKIAEVFRFSNLRKKDLYHLRSKLVMHQHEYSGNGLFTMWL